MDVTINNSMKHSEQCDWQQVVQGEYSILPCALYKHNEPDQHIVLSPTVKKRALIKYGGTEF